MEFGLILIVFPILSLLFGIIGQIFVKKGYIIIGITFIGWLIATFVFFNKTFLIWVFIYSILTAIGSGVTYFIKGNLNKRSS